MNRKCYTYEKETGEIEAFIFSKLFSSKLGGPITCVLAKPEANPKWWVILPIDEVYFEVEMPI